MKVSHNHQVRGRVSTPMRGLPLYIPKKIFPDEPECPICTEKYTKENPPFYLWCGHGFHEKCIATSFIKVARKCPLCITKEPQQTRNQINYNQQFGELILERSKILRQAIMDFNRDTESINNGLTLEPNRTKLPPNYWRNIRNESGMPPADLMEVVKLTGLTYPPPIPYTAII